MKSVILASLLLVSACAPTLEQKIARNERVMNDPYWRNQAAAADHLVNGRGNLVIDPLDTRVFTALRKR